MTVFRKILIKNKRLRPDDERREMDLWLKGQLQNEESDGEAEEHDANAINVTGTLNSEIDLSSRSLTIAE